MSEEIIKFESDSSLKNVKAICALDYEYSNFTLDENIIHMPEYPGFYNYYRSNLWDMSKSNTMIFVTDSLDRYATASRYNNVLVELTGNFIFIKNTVFNTVCLCKKICCDSKDETKVFGFSEDEMGELHSFYAEYIFNRKRGNPLNPYDLMTSIGINKDVQHLYGDRIFKMCNPEATIQDFI